MSNLTAKQERELLELRVELLRLKIAAEQLKRRQARAQQNAIDRNFMSALSLADGLPSGKLLWNTLLLPLNWRNRLLAGVGLFLWQVYRNVSSPSPRVRRRR